MKNLLAVLVLSAAPFAASAHEPAPAVYYTPQSAYYVPQAHVATHEVAVPATHCGCCGCTVAQPVSTLPPPPVIIRSVMPGPATCVPVQYQPTIVHAAPCVATTCQPAAYQAYPIEPDPGW